MQHELLVPKACDVIEVMVEDPDPGGGSDCVLVIRSVGRRGEQVRRMRAPRPTALHAAAAVARHYGLPRTAQRRWLASGSVTRSQLAC